MGEVLGKTAEIVLKGLELGKSKFAFSGVKAEFEAEGSRLDDLKILLFAGKSAGLETIVKIGGCEALRDMRDLAGLGRVENVVAPMIESAFALKKFKLMARRVHEETGFKPNLIFNLETITGLSNFDQLIDEAVDGGEIQGVTFGRGDFAQSWGLNRSQVDSQQVHKVVMQAAKKTIENGIEFSVGGSVSAASIPLLRDLAAIGARSFESRKVSWHFKDLPKDDEQLALFIESGLMFELEWLRAKSERYMAIAKEDAGRLDQLEQRFNGRFR